MEAVQKYADKFMEANPGVKINIETYSWGDFNTKWNAGLTTGDLPDMSTAQGTGEVVEMMNADVLTPIDDMVDDIGRDRFSANALADMTSDGATYGVPYYSHAQVMWYRTDLLEAAGLEVPKTWDEFLTVCQTIKDNGYEPLALDGAYANFNFYNHLVRHLGEDAIAELGKNGGWADNEAAVTAAQEIIDFVNAGYLAEGAPDAYPASQTKVGLGTAAMVVCANYVTSEVDAAVGEPVNWGFFNYPEVEGNVDASAYAGANSLAISSNCENPQAAFDFIMTIVTGTCGQELVDNGGQIPADTRLKESVLAGSVETLKNTTTPMSWCGSLNTLDGWSSIKSSMIELFEGKYATGADYCAYLDTLCG